MDELCEAIASRRLIAFDYDGHSRLVLPAAHGRHVTTPNEVLRGYQVGGSSSSRQPPFWSLFTVSKMQTLVVTDEVFTDPPPDYARDDAHINVHCQL